MLETVRGKEVRDSLPNTSRCPPWKQDRSEQRARHFSLTPPSTLPHSVSPSCDCSSHGATQLSLGLSELLSDKSGECQNPWSKARLRLSAEGMCQECSEEAKPLSYQPPLPPLQVFGKLGEGRQDPRLR